MKRLGVETYVELGVREGNSFFRHIDGVSKTAWAVDIWKETGDPAQNDLDLRQTDLDAQYAKVTNQANTVNTLGGVQCRVIRGFSAEAANEFSDGSLDVVFVDADHSYAGCKADIEAWYPKMVSGGIFCGHDYLDTKTVWRGVPVGVKDAVDEFVAANGLQDNFYVYSNSPCPTWYIVVP